MPKFAANLTMLFTELPFEQRFSAAKEAGFDYVEYLFPYEWEATTLAEYLQQHALEQVLFNLPPGRWDEGERGIASLPVRQTEFREGLDLAISYATTLGVSRLNCLSGLIDPQLTSLEQWSTLVDNLAYAAEHLAKHDIKLLIEPINSRIDMPGFLVDTLGKAKQLIQDVGHENLAIQFDIYHMQVMHGDIARLLESHLDLIQHIQFADNPGRNEPGTGELNFEFLFSQIDALGYTGFVSAEYRPSVNTRDSLGWLPEKS